MSDLIRKNSVDRLLEQLSPRIEGNGGGGRAFFTSETARGKSLEYYSEEHRLVHISHIQHWWRKHLRLNAVLSKMRQAVDAVASVSSVVRSVCSSKAPASVQEKEQAFLSSQQQLRSTKYSTDLTSFLQLLPADPQLRQRNVMARSSRFISSAVLMTAHPDDVLASDEYSDSSPGPGASGSGRDTSLEARTVLNAATALTHALLRLLHSVAEAESAAAAASASATAGASNPEDITSATALQRHRAKRAFVRRLVQYRFHCRYYLHALGVYQAYCNQALLRSMEMAYMQNYSIVVALTTIQDREKEKGADGSRDEEEQQTNAAVLQQATSQCARIRAALLRMYEEEAAAAAKKNQRQQNLQTNNAGSSNSASSPAPGSTAPAPAPVGASVRLEEIEAFVRASVVVTEVDKDSVGGRGAAAPVGGGGAESDAAAASGVAVAGEVDRSLEYLPREYQRVDSPADGVQAPPRVQLGSLLSPLEFKLLHKIMQLSGRRDPESLLWKTSFSIVQTIIASRQLSEAFSGGAGISAVGGAKMKTGLDAKGSSAQEAVSKGAAAGAPEVYQLPDSAAMKTFKTHYSALLAGSAEGSSSSSEGAAAASQQANLTPKQQQEAFENGIRRQFLRLMSDKIVAALSQSTYQSVDEVKVGDKVYAYYPNAPPAPGAASKDPATAVAEAAAPASVLLTAEVMEIEYTGDGGEQPRVPQSYKIRYCCTSNEASAAPPGAPASAQKQEEDIEDNVSPSRIKLTSHHRDAGPLLSALSQCISQILSISSEIATKYANLPTALFDAPTITQKAQQGTLSFTDLAPALFRLFDIVMHLQAAGRGEEMLRTRNYLSTAWAVSVSGMKGDVASGSLTQAEKDAAFNHIIATSLPMYLEYVSACVDELKIDMANYYITILSNSLASHNGAYRFLSTVLCEGVLSSSKTSGEPAAASSSSSAAPSKNKYSLMKTVTWLRQVLTADGGTDGSFIITEIDETGLLTPPPQAAESVVPSPLTWEYYRAGLRPTTDTNNAYYIYSVAVGVLRLLQAPVRLDNPLSIASYNYNQQQLAQTQQSASSAAKPTAAVHLPELLAAYAPQLAAVRDAVDVVAVLGAAGVIVKQLCYKHRLVPSGNAGGVASADEVALQDRLFLLLTGGSCADASDKATDSASAPAQEQGVSFETLSAELHGFVRRRFEAVRGVRASSALPSSASRSPSPGSGSNDANSGVTVDPGYAVIERELTTSLSGVFSDKHPVFALFTKRVYKVILRSMVLAATHVSQSPAAAASAAAKAKANAAAASTTTTLPPPSPVSVTARSVTVMSLIQRYSLAATPKQLQAIKRMLSTINTVFLHTLLVNGVLYSNIVNSIVDDMSQ